MNGRKEFVLFENYIYLSFTLFTDNYVNLFRKWIFFLSKLLISKMYPKLYFIICGYYVFVVYTVYTDIYHSCSNYKIFLKLNYHLLPYSWCITDPEESPFKGPRKQLSMSSLPTFSSGANEEYTKQLERMVDQYKKEKEGNVNIHFSGIQLYLHFINHWLLNIT